MNRLQQIANRFELQDLLGRGGMGEVYRATDTQTGETVAVKALNPEILANDPNLLERFVREGEALRQLNHPNIVHMVAAVEEQGRHYLVMEFVEGGSLRDLLNSRGSLPANDVVKIALEVADALTRAHHLKIIHRDLKPANVLLAKDGTPLLADFGIAHVQESSHITQTGILIGTVDYLSPEVCQGDTPDELSDIWAFGVMLFEMLSGKLPFEGKSLTAKITSILNQPVPDLNQLTQDAPDALVDLIYRMLEKDTQQRIPSVRLVGAELEALLKGRELVTPSRAVKGESRFDTPTPAVTAPKTNLPAQLTSFVGRQAELIELCCLLNDPSVHLVTIVGAGGMGKTRLAYEAGEAQLSRFNQGVFFVSLAPLESIESIIPATAQSIGFSFYEGGEPRQQLLDYLHEKSMLLIMDNFEHLLSGVNLVTEILNHAPQVKILSTSRARLNVQGEHLFHLEGMDLPDWETPADAMKYSAIKLFMQSARRVRPDFELSPDNMKFIARICKFVEGTPLGILLAASWVEMLSPEEIVKEIAKSLDFLETEQRDLPSRQQSMRAVFDYSWVLLTAKEREVFQKLSVFRGGFTREAAQEAMGASLRDLMILVDKSLLQRNPDGRYSIHELLRQYGAEKLLASGDDKRVHQFHLDFFVNQAKKAEPHLRYGAQQIHWLDFLDEEQDNLRAALEWSLMNDVDKAQQLAGSLWWFWHVRGRTYEGYQWINRILAIREDATLARAALFGMAGQQAFMMNYLKEAKILSDKSLAMFQTLGQKNGQADPLLILGILALGERDFPKAKAMIHESCGLFRNADDRWGLKKATDILGWIAEAEGDNEQARNIFEECYNISSELGDKDGASFALVELGGVFLEKKEYETALKYFEQSLAIAREAKAKIVSIEALKSIGLTMLLMGDFERSKQSFEECLTTCEGLGMKTGIARAYRYLGLWARVKGDLREALAMYRKSISILREKGDSESIVHCIMGLALITAKQGDLIGAIHLFSAANKVTPTIHDDIVSLDQNEYDQIITDARNALGENAFTAAWNKGLDINFGQAIELALKDDQVGNQGGFTANE